jgi:O-antigen/teichoic acid export membrane protein
MAEVPPISHGIRIEAPERGTGEMALLRARRDTAASRSFQSGLIAKGVVVVVRLVTVPLSLRLLGSELYGLWATILNLLNWFYLAEPGIGVGLINAIAVAAARDDRIAIRRYISTAFVAIAGLGCAVFLAVVALAGWHGFAPFLGIAGRSELLPDARSIFLVAGTSFAATFTFIAAAHVCAGMQEAWLGGIAATAGEVVSAFSILTVVILHGSPAAFAAAVTVPPAIAYALLGLYVLGLRHPDLRPRLSLATRREVRILMSTGGLATLLRFGEVALTFAPTWMIAHRLGPGFVTPFAVSFSLMYFGFATLSHYTMPLWPAYAEALTRGDREWIRSRFSRSIQVILASMTVFAAGMLVFGRTFIGVWAGPSAVPTPLLVVSLVAMMFVWAIDLCVAMLANGLGLFRQRTVSMSICLGLFLGLAWLALPSSGPPAVGFAAAAGLAIDAILVSLVILRELRPKPRV